jgi:hypothetical protein
MYYLSKKIYHNFKPLSDFIQQTPGIDFSNDFTSYRYCDTIQNIECYYMVNSNKTSAYGWIHNLNHYWYKKYYYYYIGDMNHPYDYWNLYGCTNPISNWAVDLPGFKHNFFTGYPYTISFYWIA